MVYNAPKTRRKNEADIFNLPAQDSFESMEMKQSKDFYELPDSNTKAFENDNVFESKEEKDAKIFELPANETEGDDTLYRTSDVEIIEDTNRELESMGKPIQILSMDKLKISVGGKWYPVTKEDLFAYQKRYANETGEVGNEFTRYRQFAGVSGDFEALDKIALDTKNVFNMLGDSKGSYEQLTSEY